MVLAKQIPGADVDTAYAQQFAQEDVGSPAKSSRVAFGALIFKERLGVTDRELVAQIAENPYLQYFLGLLAYHEEAPFHHSLLPTFRKRFSHDSLEQINEAITRLIADVQPKEETPEEAKGEDTAAPPKGQRLIDATYVPVDITYPTDLHLLNDARAKTEAILDRMHACRAPGTKKPRTYRQKARREYLRVVKSNPPRRQQLLQGIGNQRRYLRRNLGTIVGLAQEGLLVTLPTKRYRQLLVI